VRELLAQGASVTSRVKTYQDQMPLHFAAAGGWLDIVDVLVAAGVMSLV